MAAEFCNIQPGDTVAVWGCGPVGQFAIRSAFLLGAERVLAIDTIPERLRLAEAAGALTIDFHAHDVFDRIQEPTEKRGADACIDAMGTEPDTTSSVGQCTTTAVVTGASTGIGYQLACIAAGHVAPVACVPELRPALWPHHRRCRGDFDFATVAPQTLSVLIPVSDDSQPS